MKRKIDKLEKNKYMLQIYSTCTNWVFVSGSIAFRSPAKPEESQYADIEVTANPSYQSVGVKLDKQKDMYIVKSTDTYFWFHYHPYNWYSTNYYRLFAHKHIDIVHMVHLFNKTVVYNSMCILTCL